MHVVQLLKTALVDISPEKNKSDSAFFYWNDDEAWTAFLTESVPK